MQNLGSRVPSGGTTDTDEILDLFLGWASDAGFDLYPAQEEALLELMSGRHVVLSTPTGSGKSLVALGLHFKGLCEGRTSFYTSPIKALASEKFFSLCETLGPENVGMKTGDASINPDAGVVCCTAEVLANMALRQGADLEVPYVVMDEFHYYADRDRGWAWQVPLVTLPSTRFLLMSATLGDVTPIARHIEKKTGVDVAHVTSVERPVPLEFSYRETPLHETVEELVAGDQAPIYIVNFTRNDCAELAQGLTSMGLTSRRGRDAIREALKGARFDTPYGREFKRFLGFGIGVHHAGLLPKYRLLVEQLAQQGLLKVVSGTDTLGVGVNIPIRTVLFTKLAKFDGQKVGHLKVRDFQQIAGRAGRKGFDDRGWVVAQAPEDAISKRIAARKAAANPGRRIKKKPQRPRRDGEVSWSEDTLKRMIHSPPEPLRSRFRLTNGMILDLIQRDADVNDPQAGNFAAIRSLIQDCHEDPESKKRLIRRAAELVRSLYRLGIIRMVRDTGSSYLWVVPDEELQVDFSLFHNLSLFLVEAIDGLDPEGEELSLDLLSAVESVLEDPTVIIRAQLSKAKTELINRLKAEGVPYEERMNQLDEVTNPQPCREYLLAVFERFRGVHPWVGGDLVAPKSIAREMLEEWLSFGEYTRRYALQRSEGILLRYLSQVYKTLDQNVPDQAKTDAVWDVIGWLRSVIERIDTSLIEEWEGLRHPELKLEGLSEHEAHRLVVLQQLIENQKSLQSRIRAECRQLVRALAEKNWEDAAAGVGSVTASDAWTPDLIEEAMAPYFERYESLRFDHQARLAETTIITREHERRWKVLQRLLDPEGDDCWSFEAAVDLSGPESLDRPLLQLVRIGSD
jgi:superfamily II RNA helicase